MIYREFIKTDEEIRIRNGSRLIIRGVQWNVGEYDMENLIIGRPLLDAIGCCNLTIRITACDKYDGMSNIPEEIQK